MAIVRALLSASSSARCAAAQAAITATRGPLGALLVGASRSAADELALACAAASGAVFGLTRSGFAELAVKLALPALARQGQSPTGGLGAEAVTTRAAFDAASDHRLTYFAPVANTPGFPRAAARTLQELQMAAVPANTLRALGPAGEDLAALLERFLLEAHRSGTVPRAGVFDTAARLLRESSAALPARRLVLLDVPITSPVEEAFAAALVFAADEVFVTIPVGDDATLAAWRRLGASVDDALSHPGTPAPQHLGTVAPGTVAPGLAAGHPNSLSRLQDWLFSPETPPAVSEDDGSVEVFSAPGEGRETVEIARRVMREAARGVPFDEMAVLLRAPHTYFGLLEHAFSRAGIPAWFERGTRRPDPAGRAFLAILACADEDLSARRFAEYLSLGQVPVPATQEPGASDAAAADAWTPPTDDLIDAAVPEAERTADPTPEEEAPPPSERDSDRIVAGTLRTPWRWEELLVEAYVIKGLDRWKKRLPGLRAEYEMRLRELANDEHESPRIGALQRDITQIRHLEDVALPIVETLHAWRDEQPWSVWLSRFGALAPRVLRQPARVLRVLTEMAPLGSVGPVSLREVREVLSPRLLTLTHEPPRRRHGRVFVGTPSAARGRAFRIVFVPGLAERVFPQRVREDALLLDARRRQLPARLPVVETRADEERLQLRLAVGAASERVYISYPRVELRESRPRVPSFYVLDVSRAISGRIPKYGDLAELANRAGAASLAWPAPPVPDHAIDDFEHDLSVLLPLLKERDRKSVQGRARYLIDLNAALKRSVTERWARWQNRWSKADGLVTPSDEARATLQRHRITARSYSLTALQRYAACPYQFLLSAVYGLSPLEEPAPLQKLDPLTRGSLFHAIQTEFYRTLQKNGQLPVTEKRLASARQQLEWVIASVTRDAADRLAPAIDKVWNDEVASLRRDLLLWLEELPKDSAEWMPTHFEYAFGLSADPGRDPASTPEPALVDGRYRLRGSIDLIEKHVATGALRVTDHKTGKNRTTRATVVDGGRVLQPVLYSMAVESITGATVYEGRLWFCTTAGGYAVHPIPLVDAARRRGLEVLEVIDRGIEQGPLAARPARDACTWCDFRPVCGSEEEYRTKRKPEHAVADLEALRRMP